MIIQERKRFLQEHCYIHKRSSNKLTVEYKIVAERTCIYAKTKNVDTTYVYKLPQCPTILDQMQQPYLTIQSHQP